MIAYLSRINYISPMTRIKTVHAVKENAKCWHTARTTDYSQSIRCQYI